MPVKSDKFASPGAFRLVLAFAVFLHHTTNYNLGMSAVLVFFVLSGYWVAVMWAETYSKTSSAYFTYLVSRIWRVVPVFALCSAISWALLLARGGAPEFAGSLPHQIFSNIMIFGYNSLPYQVNIPGWSLDMEMQFYLVAPILVFLISKNIFVVFLFALGSLFSQRLGRSTTVATFSLFLRDRRRGRPLPVEAEPGMGLWHDVRELSWCWCCAPGCSSRTSCWTNRIERRCWPLTARPICSSR